MGFLRSHKVFAFGFVLLAARAVLLWVGPRGEMVAALSSLVGIGFNTLVAVACVQASLRSRGIARHFWALFAFAFFLAASAEAFVSWYEKIKGAPLAVAWPSIVFFFLFATPIALTLFLDEGADHGPVRWEQTLDLAQLGIIAFSAFLVFFYIPSLTETSGSALATLALKLHFLRDGFLLAAFVVRSQDAQSNAARALFRRAALFFLAYGVASVLYFYGRAAWKLGPDSPLDLLVGSSLVLLMGFASTWRGRPETEVIRARRRTILPAQFVPLVVPFVVLLMASRLAAEQLAVAWIAVGASFACAAARVVVTQRNQERALRALRQSESKYRELVQNMAEIVFTTDEQGRLTYISSASEPMLGYRPEDVLGRTVFDLAHPEDVPAMMQRFRENLAGQTGESEWRILSQSGQVRWLRSSSRAQFRDGRLVGVSGVATDVTERKALEERFRKAFHASPAAMTISRLEDGRYIDANERWLQLTTVSREQMLGRTSTELGFWTLEARDQFAERLRRERLVRDMEVKFRFPNGKQHTCLMSAELVDISGEASILTAIQDVTELRKMEDQLRQKQKMEAIGTLAGGVAHDFNNLLTVIRGYSQLLEERVDADPAIAGELRHIREAADRAAALTRQLLAFSRQQVLNAQVVSLNSTLANVEKLLRRLIGEDVELITRYAPDLWPVRADAGQIEQVVMNLSVNARDAMGHGGKLLFETRNVSPGEPELRDHPFMAPGEYVKLAVTDTGCGMDAETQNHIFEPFFTTKKLGEGTGLGLSTVYGIVKQSNGYVWVESEPGRGTTFHIYLPRAEAQSDRLLAAAEEPARDLGSETILLVEDDEGVRKLAATVLTTHGYKVLEATNGNEAESLSQKHSGKVDLLLTDMVMPEVSGREVAERIRKHRPKLRVLFISGYSPDTHSWQGVPQAGETILQKPFTPTSLAKKVRSILDGKTLQAG